MTEYISVGQAIITKEQYLANKSFYDNSGLLGVVGVDPPQDTSNSLSIIGDKVYSVISKIKSANIQFEFNSGISDTDIFNADVVHTDDYHLASWFIYETGLIPELTVKQANLGKELVFDPTILTQTSPSSTKFDTDVQKVTTINDAQMGDLVIFDTFQKNGTVGIYTGDGKFITILDEGGITEASFFGYDEFGNIEYTGWLTNFNGTVIRIPRLNEDDYKWYAQVSGISN